jgi:hypothetical protein
MEQQSFTTGQTSTDQAGRVPPQEELHAQTAGQYLDKALNLIGAKMRQAATLVKERAPREGVAKSALETASQALDSTGQYMMREEVGQEIRGVVRRHPLRSLGVCFALGVVFGNVARSIRR